jgi:hypothetical protein
MAEIVNLRRTRKVKRRLEKEAAAENNRVKFGTPASLRKLAASRATLAAKTLDAHKLDGKE